MKPEEAELFLRQYDFLSTFPGCVKEGRRDPLGGCRTIANEYDQIRQQILAALTAAEAKSAKPVVMAEDEIELVLAFLRRVGGDVGPWGERLCASHERLRELLDMVRGWYYKLLCAEPGKIELSIYMPDGLWREIVIVTGKQ